MSIEEKLATIAENEQKVYDAGYEKGKAEGGGGGYEDGRAYERDGMWKALLNNGSRLIGSSLFRGWTNPEFFKPTCNIVIRQAADGMFRDSKLGNIIEVCEECGIEINLSKSTNIGYLLGNSTITHFPTIDCSATSTCANVCNGAALLEKISFTNVQESQVFNGAFTGCSSLVECIVSGTIGKAFNISASEVLNKESHISILESLSTTTSGLTLTLNKTAVNNAFGIDVDDESTYTDEWNALVDARENWYISFV